jgi:hypothetical protein
MTSLRLPQTRARLLLPLLLMMLLLLMLMPFFALGGGGGGGVGAVAAELGVTGCVGLAFVAVVVVVVVVVVGTLLYPPLLRLVVAAAAAAAPQLPALLALMTPALRDDEQLRLAVESTKSSTGMHRTCRTADLPC